VLLLVAPVVDASDAEVGRQLAEDEVLEELAAIVVAQRVPAAVVGDEVSVGRRRPSAAP